jgi:type III restriction enzyme
VDLRLRLSNARVAEKAQMAFNFNDAIDPRLLKRALVEELRRIVDDKGIEAEERDLRRAIDLAGMMEPEKLKEAMKTAQARNVRTDTSEPVPEQYFGPEGLSEAEKSAYGVFPHRLNKEEQDFAAFLDADKTGTVKWWMRNPENETWATRLILPSGHRFFPDFVVGVSGGQHLTPLHLSRSRMTARQGVYSQTGTSRKSASSIANIATSSGPTVLTAHGYAPAMQKDYTRSFQRTALK